MGPSQKFNRDPFPLPRFGGSREGRKHWWVKNAGFKLVVGKINFRDKNRFQIGAFRPIRVDHTDFFQVAIKTHSFSWWVQKSELVGQEFLSDRPPDHTGVF